MCGCKMNLKWVCRVAIPVKRFHDKPEQDIEDWYELGKNDFASDIGTVS